ncbi:hypothetical protein [Anaeromyxobacter paludicola]|uniref:Lipoprotein n=1 Tax=Anaeromyxobacter paludicola TaxID=2918171 RepID=A0ABM7XBM2_9BACT|nr:hypothetical protein [Anaeromyxobacter paludicola]BDG09264.1 hypothetical protein AMPC_23770 [Anaeromyxobacter paludicola]
MKRIAMVVAVAALAACGSSSSSTPATNDGSAAKAATFNYDTGQAASPTQTAVVDSAMSGLAALRSGGVATAPGDTGEITTGLLGSTGIDFSLPVNASQTAALQKVGQALTTSGSTYGFNDDSCVQVASDQSSVKFTNCTVTITNASTNTNLTGTVNGSFVLTAATDTLTWTLTVNVKGNDENLTGIDITYSRAGNLTVTASTVKGDFGQGLYGGLTHNGTAYTFSVGESVIIDLTYANGCVTSGTLEAKRVWATRPVGADASKLDLTDKAVKITWTGCGQANIQYSK